MAAAACAVCGEGRWEGHIVPLHVGVEDVKEGTHDADDRAGRAAGVELDHAVLVDAHFCPLCAVVRELGGEVIGEVAGGRDLVGDASQRLGGEPLVFAGLEAVPAVGEVVADVVTPLAGAGTVGDLGAQDVGGTAELVLAHVDELAAGAEGGEQVGDDAGGLAAVGGVTQIVDLAAGDVAHAGGEDAGAAAEHGKRAAHALLVEKPADAVDAERVGTDEPGGAIGVEPDIAVGLKLRGLGDGGEGGHVAVAVGRADRGERVDGGVGQVGVELALDRLLEGGGRVVEGIDVELGTLRGAREVVDLFLHDGLDAAQLVGVCHARAGVDDPSEVLPPLDVGLGGDSRGGECPGDVVQWAGDVIGTSWSPVHALPPHCSRKNW